MAGIWVVGEVATARSPSSARGRDARPASSPTRPGDVTGIVIAPTRRRGRELATYVPRSLTVTEPTAADHASGMIAAGRLAALLEEHDPDVILPVPRPTGRDLAGALVGLTGLGAARQRHGVVWADRTAPSR